MNFKVLVCRKRTKEIVQSIPVVGYLEAERVERGLHVNLNKKDFYTTIRVAQEDGHAAD